eukprot:TRINITY_DN1404_c0_g1_i16.p1 TRINITY_DN1404_c0_g1~~TRINITY_DN1404_c0_g1_i16.p1  ORF type:complete len:372 (+),score=91.41 TRINITY_DN1404_c0_g1_i16:133-1248(+)
MTDGSGGGGDEAAAGGASGGSAPAKAATTPAVSSAAAMSPFGRYESVAVGSAGSTFISLGCKTAHGIDIPPTAPTVYDDDDESDWDEEEEEVGSGTEAADRDMELDRKASVAAAAAAFKAMTSPQSVAIPPPALVASSALSLAPSTMPLASSTTPPLTVRMAEDDDDDDEVVAGDSVDALVGHDAVSLEEPFGATPAAAHGSRAARDRDVQMVVVRSASSLTLSSPPSSTPGANIIAAARAAHAATIPAGAPLADVASSDRASGEATSSTSSDSVGDGGLLVCLGRDNDDHCGAHVPRGRARDHLEPAGATQDCRQRCAAREKRHQVPQQPPQLRGVRRPGRGGAAWRQRPSRRCVGAETGPPCRCRPRRG